MWGDEYSLIGHLKESKTKPVLCEGTFDEKVATFIRSRESLVKYITVVSMKKVTFSNGAVGNRERAEKLYLSLEDNGVSTFALADSEFCDLSHYSSEYECKKLNNDHFFYTTGHSIENYALFDLEFLFSNFALSLNNKKDEWIENINKLIIFTAKCSILAVISGNSVATLTGKLNVDVLKQRFDSDSLRLQEFVEYAEWHISDEKLDNCEELCANIGESLLVNFVYCKLVANIIQASHFITVNQRMSLNQKEVLENVFNSLANNKKISSYENCFATISTRIDTENCI